MPSPLSTSTASLVASLQGVIIIVLKLLLPNKILRWPLDKKRILGNKMIIELLDCFSEDDIY